jgi:hypothetical protein
MWKILTMATRGLTQLSSLAVKLKSLLWSRAQSFDLLAPEVLTALAKLLALVSMCSLVGDHETASSPVLGVGYV